MARISDVTTEDGLVTACHAVVDVPSPTGARSWTNRSKTFKVQKYGSIAKARRAANKWAHDLEEQRDNGRAEWFPTVTLGEYKSQFWDLIVQDLRPNVRRNYQVAWKHWLDPWLGARRLDDLRGSDIELLKREMARSGMAPSTQNGIINALSRVLNFAVRDRRLSMNVAAEKGVRLRVSAHTKRKPVILDPKQVEVLAAACDRESLGAGAAVRLLFYLAVRANELWALRIGDIDLAQRRVQVVRAWAGSDENGRHLAAPKSGKSRTIPVFEPIVADLRQLSAARSRDDWLFANSRGTAIYHQRFRERVRWCELVSDLGFPGLQVHDLRRSSTTWMLGLGLPPSTVQQVLGHSSLAMTAQYFTPQDSALDSAIRVVEASDIATPTKVDYSKP